MAIELTGAEARGKAGVFGTPTNPLSIYLQDRAGRQKRDADLYEEARKRRNDLIDHYLKYEPGKAWETQQYEIEELANQARQATLMELHQGVPETAVMSNAERRFGAIKGKVGESLEKKREYLGLEKMIADNPKLIKKSATDALRSFVYRHDNPLQARPIGEVDLQAATTAVNHPSNYNRPVIYREFLDNIPLMVRSNEDQFMGELGQQSNITRLETKLGLQKDKDGDYIIDPRTNKPAVAMTEAVLNAALQDEYISNILAEAVPDGNRDKQREFLANEMGVFNPVKIEQGIQLGHKLDKDDREADEYTAFKIKFGTKVAPMEARRDWVDKVVTKKDPRLLSAISNMIGDVKLEYVKGGSSFTPTFGQKPKTGQQEFIRVHYPSGALPENATEADYVNKLFGTGSKRKDHIDIPIGSDELNRKAELQLSNIIDKLNPKQSIGADEYVRYTEAWRKNNKKATGSGKYDGV